jgi:hypothetical protein
VYQPDSSQKARGGLLNADEFGKVKEKLASLLWCLLPRLPLFHSLLPNPQPKLLQSSPGVATQEQGGDVSGGVFQSPTGQGSPETPPPSFIFPFLLRASMD